MDVHDEVPVIFTHSIGGHAGVVPRIQDTSWLDLEDLPLTEDLEVFRACQKLKGRKRRARGGRHTQGWGRAQPAV